MDYADVASELVRALRGRRSQTAFSKWLGYRSNVASAWEAGRAFPTASDFFSVLERSGRKLAVALSVFYRLPADAVAHDLTTARGNEIQALATYNKALAQLSLDEASTLQRLSINVEVK